MPNIKIRCTKRDFPPPWDVRASEDVAHVVDFLVAGLYTDDEALFSGFVTWTADADKKSSATDPQLKP
jgi:hypothetical protein